MVFFSNFIFFYNFLFEPANKNTRQYSIQISKSNFHINLGYLAKLGISF